MQLEKKVDTGLAILKCDRCKAPTLFELHIWEKDGETVCPAGRYCQHCEANSVNPLKSVLERTLKPAAVDAQRIDVDCHVPIRGDDSGE